MSIIRAIQGIIKTWHTEELEQLIECLKQQKIQDDFYEEVVDAVEKEIRRRKDAERIFNSGLDEERNIGQE